MPATLPPTNPIPENPSILALSFPSAPSHHNPRGNIHQPWRTKSTMVPSASTWVSAHQGSPPSRGLLFSPAFRSHPARTPAHKISSPGTTYSCVATYEGNNVEIIANEQGSFTTPSFVSFSEKERLIGEAAKNQAAMNPANTVFDIKYVVPFVLARRDWKLLKRSRTDSRVPGVLSAAATMTPPLRRTPRAGPSRSLTRVATPRSRSTTSARPSLSPPRRSPPWSSPR